jgi:ribose-phosphate pyrophosphokinase
MHVTAAPRRADLAERLADALGATPVPYEREVFPDGEVLVRAGPDLGEDAVVLGDLRPEGRFVETLAALDAAREAGAGTVTLAAPYLAYARQDRAFEPGEGVTARAVNRALAASADRLCTVDVHAEAVLDHFDGPALSEPAAPEVANGLADRGVDLVLAPDAGARELAEAVGDRLDVPHDHLEKTRHSSTDVSMEPKELDAGGAAVAIVDDIISTGGTMSEATGHLLDAGAERVLVAATHGVFARGADKRLEDAGVDAVLATDSIPSDRSEVTCAGALARGLQRLPGT